jgi:hypothetical protein
MTPADGDDGIDSKAAARQWEGRAKANRDELAVLQADVADVAGLRARLATAEADAAAARLDLARHRVAAQFQHPIELVVGETEEEMRANAAKLATWVVARPDRRPFRC